MLKGFYLIYNFIVWKFLSVIFFISLNISFSLEKKDDIVYKIFNKNVNKRINKGSWRDEEKIFWYMY